MAIEKSKNSEFKQKFKKRCFDFSIEILNLSQDLRKRRINWEVLDQLIRSATSIGANVVEGGNSVSKKEFINYFQIALKSASETIYWLAILKELNKNRADEIGELITEVTEIKKLISTIIINTRSNS
jgi:four helix bundle protein